MPPRRQSALRASERTRLALPVAPRARRTHAERTAATRARLIAAVVDAIADLGLQRATAVEISRRAGVTWGAVQHHFGGKEAMLVAVLEDSFDRFAERIEGLVEAEVSLPKRVKLFVEGAWEHFRSRHYRAANEILVGYLGRLEPRAERSWQERMARAWDSIWTKVFADVAIPRRKMLLLQRYTVSVLSGLASMATLARTTSAPAQELVLLEETLVRELGGG
jgi:AcrR family transcriptional regulator